MIRRARICVSLPENTLADLKEWASILGWSPHKLVELAARRVPLYNLTLEVESPTPCRQVYFNLDIKDRALLTTSARLANLKISRALSRALTHTLIYVSENYSSLGRYSEPE